MNSWSSWNQRLSLSLMPRLMHGAENMPSTALDVRIECSSRPGAVATVTGGGISYTVRALPDTFREVPIFVGRGRGRTRPEMSARIRAVLS